MTNDRPWNAAARNARDHRRQVVCGPAGPDRDALASEYREANKLAGASPGIPFWRIERPAEARGLVLSLPPLGYDFGFVLVKLQATFSACSTRKRSVYLPGFVECRVFGVRRCDLTARCPPVSRPLAPSGATAFSGSGMRSGTTLAAGAVSVRTIPLLRYFSPITALWGPTNGTTRQFVNPASRIQPMQSAPV